MTETREDEVALNRAKYGTRTAKRKVPAPSAPPLPTSFAGGRYAVRRFLGEGGRKLPKEKIREGVKTLKARMKMS